MAPPINQDWDFLETIISLSSEMTELVNKIKEDTDEPLVLQRTMYLESNALLIWKMARDYRPRLELLRKLAEGNGLEILEQITLLADEIKTTATGPPLNNHKKTSGLSPHTTSQTKRD